MKQILITDLDNTTFDTRECHSLYLNHTYKIKSVPEDFVNNASLAGIIKKYKNSSTVTDGEVLSELGEHFHISSKWHKAIKPIDQYVKEVITELTKKYLLIIATARPDNSEKIIRQLLETHFPGCIKIIHFVHKRIVYGQFDIVQKRDFVISLGPQKCVGFIDDSINEIKKMQDLIKSHLFDPWHLHEKEPEIQNRVYSWKEMGDIYL